MSVYLLSPAQQVCPEFAYHSWRDGAMLRVQAPPQPLPCSDRAAFHCVHNQAASPAAIIKLIS